MRFREYWRASIKVVILAGGLGTRMGEETELKPKPMVLIDSNPILWHIMKIYVDQGFDDFIIATGYKHEVIDRWVTSSGLPWRVKTLFTGENTQTGGRIKKVIQTLDEEIFFLTYGDGLGNIRLADLLKLHLNHGKLATVTAVRPPARFGYLETEQNRVIRFGEKSQMDVGWINGGYFCLSTAVDRYIDHDLEPFETGALPRLVDEGQLMANFHDSFWLPMDTRSERDTLAAMANEETAPWLQGLM